MGRSYKIACGDDERESLLEAVQYLDAKMGEIKSSGRVASAERIAVMAALNISHELLAAGRQQGQPGGFDSDSAKRRMASMQAMLEDVLSASTKVD